MSTMKTNSNTCMNGRFGVNTPFQKWEKYWHRCKWDTNKAHNLFHVNIHVPFDPWLCPQPFPVCTQKSNMFVYATVDMSGFSGSHINCGGTYNRMPPGRIHIRCRPSSWVASDHSCKTVLLSHGFCDVLHVLLIILICWHWVLMCLLFLHDCVLHFVN